METSKRSSHEVKDRVLLYGLPVIMAINLLIMLYYLVFVPDDPEHTWVVYLLGTGLMQMLRKLHQAMRGDLN